MEKVITIFGSGLLTPDDELYGQTEQIGKLIAENKYIVCSGGYGGVMEAVSKGARSAGGRTYGITVSAWKSIPNEFIDEEIRMPNLMERLTELIALGDAYVVCKGETGTLVEIAMTFELMNKQSMKEKRIIFYTDYWKPIIERLKSGSERISDLINRNVRFVNSIQELEKELDKI